VDGINEAGWLSSASRCPSPNFNERPDGGDIRLIVVHGISLPPGQFGGTYIEQFFTNTLDPLQHPYFETIAHLQVSAHLLIRRDGQVVQFVPFISRAWHAGKSSYLGRENCNDFSIGIELEGTDDEPYEEVQYQILADVIRVLQQYYPDTREHVVGHSDIAPGRKTDPGRAFSWSRLESLLAQNVTDRKGSAQGEPA
jgi:AmpD protein